MITVEIEVNNGQTHNLNLVYGVQMGFGLNKEHWSLVKKYATKFDAKQAANDEGFYIGYPSRVVKIYYKRPPEKTFFISAKTPERNWLQRAFNLNIPYYIQYPLKKI